MTNLLQPMPMERMVEHVARELEMTSMVFSVAPGYRPPARSCLLGGWTCRWGRRRDLTVCWPRAWSAPMWREPDFCPWRRWGQLCPS